ncbi:hypothetical protein OJ997_21540 [Solirubrobacter phytolaccae]|uniref:Uncharacterized protein n=1 Tax=Solirubrobacter phytolaccae TaxID=1404360 RepID=A0A9X3NDJ3_9ACTN|nr:hypothetical protein [Solirubrobacter phytolaccae]MDA0182910.1 hypothetical protein [Solirubrobacter phytolaccae]
MSTIPIRVPAEVHQQVSRLAKLCGNQPAELLAAAWSEYLERHRDDFASDLEKAAALVRDGSLDELVDFVQDAHATDLVVDADDLAAAQQDEAVIEAVAAARRAVEASRSAGRRHEL